MAIQPGFSFENRTRTWKHGHGHHWYVRKKPLGVDIWGYVNACILLFLFIIQTLKFFTLFIFHYFLFILMFPFCLHATSALYKPITIFFCIIKRFWIFDMFLNFLYVLDVNKNNFSCNLWSYLIVKRFQLWLLFPSGTMRLGVVSCILSWIFESDGITSQMEGYFSILLFSILLYHTGL